MTRNVGSFARSPKDLAPPVEPLTLEEAQTFLRSVRGDYLEAFYHLSLTYGLRRGEVLGLRWADIDLERRLFSVRMNLQRVKGQLYLGEVKSRAGLRTMPLAQDLIALLRERRARQNEERLAAGLPRRRLHGLRHTAAHLMLAQGIPLEVVKVILGHASIQITVDGYGHVWPAAQIQAIETMRRALVGPE